MKILGTLRQFPDRSLVSLALALAFSAPVGSASSATCAPKSSVTSSCQDLDLDGTENSVGAITVSSGATVTNSGDDLFSDYTVRFSGSIDSFTNNGIVSGVNGGGGTFLFLNGTSILNGIVNNGTLTSKDFSIYSFNDGDPDATVSNGIKNYGAVTSGDYYINAGGDGLKTFSGGILNASSGTISSSNNFLKTKNTNLSGGIENYGTISSRDHFFRAEEDTKLSGGIKNYGAISSTSDFLNASGLELSGGIHNEGSITTGLSFIYAYTTTLDGGINNYGTVISRERFILTDPWNASEAVFINGGILNAGSITTETRAAFEFQEFTTVTGGISNLGVITAGTSSSENVFTVRGATISGGIENSGTMYSPERRVLFMSGGVITGGITNSGIMEGKTSSGGDQYDAMFLRDNASIDFITNTGSIYANRYGINVESGTITTLNNLQGIGNTNGGLKYNGILPTNYNVIINSASQYGQLVVTNPSGTTTFGISPLSGRLTALRYEDVVSGVAAGQFTDPTRTGTYRGATWNLIVDENASDTWDLVFVAASPQDTQESLAFNATALRNAFNLQSAKMAQGLSYDCSVFDAKNICVSFAGTRSNGKDGLDDNRGALILAHKPNANVRFGGYIDQGFDSSESGGLKVKQSSPGYGVFAVWSEKADGSGLQVRGSASFGKTDIESTRTAIGMAEPGFGQSDIKSGGFQIEASRGYAVNTMWSAHPYVGYRQVTNRRAGYTETDAVEFPLAYSSIKQTTQSLLAGVRFAHAISAQATMTVAAGLEHDMKNDVDRYTAINAEIGDIDSIDMESGKKNTRPTLSLGLNHVIDKAQRIGVLLTHRKEAFDSASTTSGMVQYSRGF